MMSKRNNVVFSKPDEPLFLKKLKQQIGYCEGPTVDTKRERRSFSDGEDSDQEKLDDQPTIVVLNPGDLSAEQVEIEKEKDRKGKETAPANLKDRIIFKPTSKKEEASKSVKKEEASKSVDDCKKSSKKQAAQPKSKSNLLSFDDDEDQDD